MSTLMIMEIIPKLRKKKKYVVRVQRPNIANKKRQAVQFCKPRLSQKQCKVNVLLQNSNNAYICNIKQA